MNKAHTVFFQILHMATVSVFKTNISDYICSSRSTGSALGGNPLVAEAVPRTFSRKSRVSDLTCDMHMYAMLCAYHPLGSTKTWAWIQLALPVHTICKHTCLCMCVARGCLFIMYHMCVVCASSHEWSLRMLALLHICVCIYACLCVGLRVHYWWSTCFSRGHLYTYLPISLSICLPI